VSSTGHCSISVYYSPCAGYWDTPLFPNFHPLPNPLDILDGKHTHSRNATSPTTAMCEASYNLFKSDSGMSLPLIHIPLLRSDFRRSAVKNRSSLTIILKPLLALSASPTAQSAIRCFMLDSSALDNGKSSMPVYVVSTPPSPFPCTPLTFSRCCLCTT
jgi:hypothetical protein